MKNGAAWIVAMLALMNVPLAMADEPDQGDPIEVVIRPLPDIIADCTWLTVGDQVGYDPEKFAYESVGLGLHVAEDTFYLAIGLFSGGAVEQKDGVDYVVFTILSGFSGKADWCDRLLDPGNDGGNEPVP